MLTWLLTLGSRIEALIHGKRMDDELDQELQSHVEMLTEENLRRGLMPDEARRMAMVRLGGIAQIKESNRDKRGLPRLEMWASDVRYTLRGLRKSPGFSVVVVLSLALGIGANTAIFTLVDSILLKWLPVKQPEQLMTLRDPTRKFGQRPYWDCFKSYTELRDRNTVFSDLVARNWWELYVGIDGQNQPLNVELVSGNYFDMLGVSAFL